MGEIVVNGIPSFVRRWDVDRGKTVRITPKKRGFVNFGIKRLNGRQKATLNDLMKKGETGDLSTAAKKEAGLVGGYSETYAVQAVNRLLERKPILDALEKAGVTDEKIAHVILGGLSAEHPLAKGKKDYHAIAKFVSEANRIKDNYPPTRVEQKKQEQVLIVQVTGQDIAALEKVKSMRGQT